MTRTRLNESTRLASRRLLRATNWLIYGMIILSLLALPPAPVVAQAPVSTTDFTDPYEPNNVWQQAALVTPGTIQAAISGRRDVDFFKVTVNQADSTLLSLIHISEPTRPY